MNEMTDLTQAPQQSESRDQARRNGQTDTGSKVAEASAQYLAQSAHNATPASHDCPPGYKRTEVGVIPEDWEVVVISEVLEEISMGPFGSDIKVSNFVNSGVPVLSGLNVRSEKLKDDFSNYVSLEKAKSLKKAVARRGDIIVTHRGTIGQISYIPDDSLFDRYVISQSQFRARFKEKILSPWVVLYFVSPRGSKKLLEGKGHTGVPAIAQATTTFRKLLLPLPSRKEQTAIANALSDVDALISELEKLIAKKQAIKTATMQQLLTGRIRLPQFALREDGTPKGYKQSELGEIPEDWEVVGLGSVIDKFVGGGTPSRSNKEYWGNKIPWVTVKDFATFNPYTTQESITKKGLLNSASNLIPKGTLITSTRMALGKSVIYQVDVAINQDMKALFCGNELSTEFLYFWFEANKNKIEELGSGSTVKGLALSDFKKVSFILPIKEEQTAIATILYDMDEEIQALQQRLAKTRQIKQGMMQELLTGRVRLTSGKLKVES